jgi:hypothetical protein
MNTLEDLGYVESRILCDFSVCRREATAFYRSRVGLLREVSLHVKGPNSGDTDYYFARCESHKAGKYPAELVTREEFLVHLVMEE